MKKNAKTKALKDRQLDALFDAIRNQTDAKFDGFTIQNEWCHSVAGAIGRSGLTLHEILWQSDESAEPIYRINNGGPVECEARRCCVPAAPSLQLEAIFAAMRAGEDCTLGDVVIPNNMLHLCAGAVVKTGKTVREIVGDTPSGPEGEDLFCERILEAAGDGE